MAYTIGASHGPFSGSGNFVISKPVGIRTVLSDIPAHVGWDGGSPGRYFKVGRFTLGTIHGFKFSHGLEYQQQLLYPIEPVWELLAYDLPSGASCLFEELVGVPDLSLKQPWDRTPLTVVLGGALGFPGGTASTTSFSYTVPTGRRLLVTGARVRFVRTAAATTVGTTYGYIQFAGSNAILAYSTSNLVGVTMEDSLPGGGHILNAGQVINGVYLSTDVVGFWVGNVSLTGYLFDA